MQCDQRMNSESLYKDEFYRLNGKLGCLKHIESSYLSKGFHSLSAIGRPVSHLEVCKFTISTDIRF